MQRKHHLFFVICFAGFLVLFLKLLNFSYPVLGHDYFDFFPKLIAGTWHFARQGLAPFRFSPHFCGGLPRYGNPQDLYYSLPQFLTFVMDPWAAAQLSMVTVLAAGYWGWYRVARDIIVLTAPWSHALALIINASGFYLMHMVVGHMGFHTLPLLGILLWILCDPKEDSATSLAARVSAFALTAAAVLYSGGFFVLMLLSLAYPLLLPIVLFTEKRRLRSCLRTVASRLLFCGLAALLISLSKLVAVWSIMRFFPRSATFDHFAEGTNVLLFAARAFFYIPQGRFLFASAGVPLQVHEYSMFLSPIVLMGLLCGPPLLIAKRHALRRNLWGTGGALLYTLVLLTFFTQLARGYGLFAAFLQRLPGFHSFHVTPRFLYLFSITLSILSVWCIERCLRWRESKEKWNVSLAMGACMLTIIALPVAYYPLLRSPELLRNLQYDFLKRDLEKKEYLTKNVSLVTSRGTDLTHVVRGTTGIRCIEALFGYSNEHQITSLAEGPTDRTEDGFFNLNHPACFQYPEENECRPGDRIAASDRENFDRFIRGEQTTWKLSKAQVFADRLSFITLIGMLALLLGSPFWASRRAKSATAT